MHLAPGIELVGVGGYMGMVVQYFFGARLLSFRTCLADWQETFSRLETENGYRVLCLYGLYLSILL